TTSTTTPSTTTPTSFASNENAIEESTSQSEIRQLPEKRAKFISENSTNAQQLTLPNTAEVWSLAGMKAVPKAPLTTTTVLPLFNDTDLANDIDIPHNRTEQHKEKNLLDWQQIAMMQSTPENRTEFVVRTTLDATEGATQATTEALAEASNTETSGLEQNEVTTAKTIPVTSDASSIDQNVTTTTARTELLDVPMVKKMSDAASAKLTEAVTEAQTESEAVTVKTRDSLSNANELRTAEKTDNAVNNSVAITESELGALATTVETTPPTTTTSSLLSDLSKLSKEHESSLETNNIGEAPPESTTSAAAAAVAVATDESTAATGGQEIVKETHHHEGQQVVDEQDTEQQLAKTIMAVTATTTSTTTTTTTVAPSTTTTMQPVVISLLDDSTTTSTTTTTTTTTTAAPPTEEYVESSTVASTTSSSIMLPETTTTTTTTITTQSPQMPPNLLGPYPNELDHMQTNAQGNGTDVNVIIAITVSVIGVVALILLVAFLYLMRKRQKQMSYGQRCRPVSLDAYSLDNVSVLGSVRRKGRDVRASKRTYGNAAFDDPSLRHNLLTAGELARFVERRSDVFEEFRDVPQIIARADEVPPGCEDKNRYANVIPLPETRVVLQRQGDDDKTEYINANYVRGPRDAPNYYIACQAPLESTTSDFWRMIWEQQSRVIIQATDLSENGIEKCAEYLPPSATLDNHSSYGDYQVTLKHREVKDRYAISTLILKRVDGEENRELTHYWYKWPEAGVPAEEAPIIAMLLEARSSLKTYCLEQASELREKTATLETSMDADGSNAEAGSTSSNEINGNISSRSGTKNQQGPLTVHCSPGTGRTGTIIASDMAIRSLETPKRSVDIPQLVYYVRRGRASAVQTKEQYEFIYKVASMYAAKITNLSNDN
ncbi:hypothetical protein M5D96_001095, partial [Drosophila gunungcola]